MQQIYDVVITEWETEVQGSYTKTQIDLEYKIRKNNGTLRNDMDSDSSKSQKIMVTTNNSAGVAKIDAVTVVTYLESEDLPPVSYNVANIVWVSAASFVLVAAAVLGLAVTFKKTKRKIISDVE